ncbi:MAG TPA: CHAT domain-containing protein [Roseiflexaceae bacterium]|nr:CHAT domain-containing protein [Roseiflexaceae bacterium]
MRQYIDLTIVFGVRNPDGTYSLSVRSPYGDANGLFRLPTVATYSRALAARLQLPPSTPLYQELADRLETFAIDEEGLALLGQLLFGALFEDPQVRTIYDRTRGSIENDPDKRARIRLELLDNTEATVEVGRLPWEFLFDPDFGPLALLDFSVVRYPIVALGQTPLKVQLPLKVLLTAAVTPPPTEIADELVAVREGLKQLGDRVIIIEEPHLTNQILQRRLREGFHVWHFVGHGAVKPDGQGVLVLEDRNSTPGDLADPFPISALQLQVMLNRSGVRLIVLDACETSKLVNKPFDSLAPALLRAQVSSVITMQFSVRDQTTVEFAREFYKALSEGFPIDACVNEGRKAVMGLVGLGQPDWGIPTVYARIEDGHLFEFGGTSGAVGSTPPVAGGAGPLIGDTTVNLGSGNTISNSNIEIGTVIKGVQSVRFGGLDVLRIADKDGRMLQGSSAGAASEELYGQELARLNEEVVLVQRPLFLHKQTRYQYGIVPPYVEGEIAKLEPQLYSLLKERAELRMGRLEELERLAVPGDQEAARQIAEQVAAYLDDVATLKRMELPWCENALRTATNAVDRDNAKQRLDQLNQQLDLLNTQSKNAHRNRKG